MTDYARDIGGLEARMDEHEKRLDRIEQKVDDGFASITTSLSAITAAENRRKGAITLVKLAVGAGGLAGIWELAKTLFHR